MDFETVTEICPICKGMEFIYYTDEKGNGWGKPCECREKNIMKNRLKFAELPEAYRDVSLKNFDIRLYQNQESEKIIKNACAMIKFYLQNIDQIKEHGMGLYLQSHTKGSGKTRMMASIANELMQAYKMQVKFAVSTTILNEIKATYSDTAISESQLLDQLCTVEVLCIDDFGMERVSDWVNEKYQHILNERYINEKITIYTSNLRLDELAYDARVTSRINERSYFIDFPEESVRERIAEEKQKEIIEQLKK